MEPTRRAETKTFPEMTKGSKVLVSSKIPPASKSELAEYVQQMKAIVEEMKHVKRCRISRFLDAEQTQLRWEVETTEMPTFHIDNDYENVHFIILCHGSVCVRAGKPRGDFPERREGKWTNKDVDILFYGQQLPLFRFEDMDKLEAALCQLRRPEVDD